MVVPPDPDPPVEDEPQPVTVSAEMAATASPGVSFRSIACIGISQFLERAADCRAPTGPCLPGSGAPLARAHHCGTRRWQWLAPLLEEMIVMIIACMRQGSGSR